MHCQQSCTCTKIIAHEKDHIDLRGDDNTKEDSSQKYTLTGQSQELCSSSPDMDENASVYSNLLSTDRKCQ